MKKTVLFLLVLALSLPLFAQGPAEMQGQVSDSFRATDANGRTLLLDETPTSVMIAGKAAVMPANALFLFPEVEAMDLQLSKTDQGLGIFFPCCALPWMKRPDFPSGQVWRRYSPKIPSLS